eukprot:TRINITY_DN385_c0_g1_i2.p2 TRINITY_DN385_c0_g1~~TRINITY_DN385_c0_g1_i2.p2  ORF type:complete len:108 (-),score=6.30 TRINITY_DN385_c0_g1_i2:10-333(-)
MLWGRGSTRRPSIGWSSCCRLRLLAYKGRGSAMLSRLCDGLLHLCKSLGLRVPALPSVPPRSCLLYTSDAADEEDSVDLGGRRIIKKKNRGEDSGEKEVKDEYNTYA